MEPSAAAITLFSSELSTGPISLSEELSPTLPANAYTPAGRFTCSFAPGRPWHLPPAALDTAARPTAGPALSNSSPGVEVRTAHVRELSEDCVGLRDFMPPPLAGW